MNWRPFTTPGARTHQNEKREIVDWGGLSLLKICLRQMFQCVFWSPNWAMGDFLCISQVGKIFTSSDCCAFRPFLLNRALINIVPVWRHKTQFSMPGDNGDEGSIKHKSASPKEINLTGCKQRAKYIHHQSSFEKLSNAILVDVLTTFYTADKYTIHRINGQAM